MIKLLKFRRAISVMASFLTVLLITAACENQKNYQGSVEILRITEDHIPHIVYTFNFKVKNELRSLRVREENTEIVFDKVNGEPLIAEIIVTPYEGVVSAFEKDFFTALQTDWFNVSAKLVVFHLRSISDIQTGQSCYDTRTTMFGWRQHYICNPLTQISKDIPNTSPGQSLPTLPVPRGSREGFPVSPRRNNR